MAFCPILKEECKNYQCAMWRWKSPFPEQKFIIFNNVVSEEERISYMLRKNTSKLPKHPSSIPDTWEWCFEDRSKGQEAGWREPLNECLERCKNEGRGYCGFAGEPEY